jgi:hypothetical protein
MELYFNASIEGKNYIPIDWVSKKLEVQNRTRPSGDAYQWISFKNDRNINELNKFIDVLYSKLDLLKKNKFQKIQIWIMIVKNAKNEQCNFELNHRILKKLDKLKATMCVEYTVSSLN